MSDIDTAVVDSLKVLDLKWPIREADIRQRDCHVRKVPTADIPPYIRLRALSEDRAVKIVL